MLNSDPRGNSERWWPRRTHWRPRAHGWRVCQPGHRSPSEPWFCAGVPGRSGWSPVCAGGMPSRASGSTGTVGSSCCGRLPRRWMPIASGSKCWGAGASWCRAGNPGAGRRAWSYGGTSAMHARSAGCASRPDGMSENPSAGAPAAHSENPVISREPFGETHGLCALVSRRSRNGARGRPLYSGRFFGQAHRAYRETRRFWNMVHE